MFRFFVSWRTMISSMYFCHGHGVSLFIRPEKFKYTVQETFIVNKKYACQLKDVKEEEANLVKWWQRFQNVMRLRFFFHISFFKFTETIIGITPLSHRRLWDHERWTWILKDWPPFHFLQWTFNVTTGGFTVQYLKTGEYMVSNTTNDLNGSAIVGVASSLGKPSLWRVLPSNFSHGFR